MEYPMANIYSKSENMHFQDLVHTNIEKTNIETNVAKIFLWQ